VESAAAEGVVTVHCKFPRDEARKMADESVAGGYGSLTAYLRALVRLGYDHRAELRPEAGRHYVRDRVGDGRGHLTAALIGAEADER